MRNVTISQAVALDVIGSLLNSGDFTNTDKLLAYYTESFDNIKLNNLPAAAHLFNFLGTGIHEFSILKTPFIISLSNYIDATKIKPLMLHSSDASSTDADFKLAALNCYLDNKKDPQFYSNNNCLKNILGPSQTVLKNATSVEVLKAHVKCEPGLDCASLKEYFGTLYNTTNPIVTKVLDVAAKGCLKDDCNIIYTYDNSYSVKDGSAPKGSSTQGYYNFDADVFITGRSDEYRNFSVAHEVNHYAIDAIYHNNAKPYPEPIPNSRFNAINPSQTFHSTKFAFQMASNAMKTLLQIKPPQNEDQTEIQFTLKDFVGSAYPINQIDMELAVRYTHFLADNKTLADVDYYMKPIEDYYHNFIIPDINNFLLDS
jgi:hypothetical protein